jgi:hypothetical protein
MGFWKEEKKKDKEIILDGKEVRAEAIRLCGSGNAKVIIDNIEFETRSSMYDSISNAKVTITLVNEGERLAVFYDTEWIYTGSWCKKISSIFEDSKIKAEQVKKRQTQELNDKVARFDKAFGGAGYSGYDHEQV